MNWLGTVVAAEAEIREIRFAGVSGTFPNDSDRNVALHFLLVHYNDNAAPKNKFLALNGRIQGI